MNNLAGTTRFFTDAGLTIGATFSPTERMRITSAGNVGIKTTLPNEKLQVAGDIQIGTGTTGCVKDGNGTIIAGAPSDCMRYGAGRVLGGTPSGGPVLNASGEVISALSGVELIAMLDGSGAATGANCCGAIGCSARTGTGTVCGSGRGAEIKALAAGVPLCARSEK